jgi:hypothetical protein
MKHFFLFCLSLTSITTYASNSDIKKILCHYETDGRGILELKFERQEDDSWKLLRFDAGKNLSHNKNIILLDTYGTVLRGQGVYARYDIESNTMEFKYKYNSGWNGGGRITEKGTTSDCVTE